MSLSHKIIWKSDYFNTDLDSICVLPDYNIVLVTSKASNELLEFNLLDGKLVNKWKEGWRRPNGIANYGNYVFVIEKDGKLLTIYNYSNKNNIFSWGNNILKKPYGICIAEINGIINVLITDDGKNKIVYKLRFNKNLDLIDWSKIIELDGRSKLESIYLDPKRKIILLADEAKYLIYIYNFNTNKLIDIIGERFLTNEPEGIAKFKNYYIITNQCKKDNTFYFLDENSYEIEYKIADNKNVSNTDGICIFDNKLLVINDDRQLVAYELTLL